MITMGKTHTFSVAPEGLNSFHLVRHTQSDRHSCVKNEKEGQREKFKPWRLSHLTAGQSWHEAGGGCECRLTVT